MKALTIFQPYAHLICLPGDDDRSKRVENRTWHGVGSPFENWRVLLDEPHVCRVDDGVSSTVDIRPRLHAYGNAIVPAVAAVFIRAFMESIGSPLYGDQRADIVRRMNGD